MKMKKSLSSFCLSFFLLSACTGTTVDSQGQNDKSGGMAELPTDGDKYAVATLAGGCFWCTEAVFEQLNGVEYVISGYAGGIESNPKYNDVSAGITSHAETIQIYYDPKVINFKSLLEVFFTAAHDPTQLNGQGSDIGEQYRSIAFYRTDEEKQAIESEIQTINASKIFESTIVTQVVPFKKFYPAEKYHQDYFPANQGNPYVQNVTRPKVEGVKEQFPTLLKDQ